MYNLPRTVLERRVYVSVRGLVCRKLPWEVFESDVCARLSGRCAHNMCESNHVAQCLCECVGGHSEGACGKLEEAKWPSEHVNELKVSAANYSPASLLVWQRGHSLLMV